MRCWSRAARRRRTRTARPHSLRLPRMAAPTSWRSRAPPATHMPWVPARSVCQCNSCTWVWWVLVQLRLPAECLSDSRLLELGQSYVEEWRSVPALGEGGLLHSFWAFQAMQRCFTSGTRLTVCAGLWHSVLAQGEGGLPCALSGQAITGSPTASTMADSVCWRVAQRAGAGRRRAAAHAAAA